MLQLPWFPRWPALNERTTVAVMLLVASAIAVLGRVDSVPVALAPLPVAVLISLVRKAPAVAAASLPLICISIDGLLVHLHMQTPVRVSSVVLILLLWVVLSSKMRFHARAAGIGAWFSLLLIGNYILVTRPTGNLIDTKVLALLLEGFVVCAVVASVAPHPQISVAAVGLAGLAVTYFAYFPEYSRGGRPYALGLDPNYIGTIVAIGIVALATLARVRKTWYPLVPTIPMVGALIQVQSRAAAIAMVAGLVGVLSLSPIRFRSYLVLMTAAAFIAGGALMGLQPGYGAFTERRIDTEDSSKVRDDIRKVGVSAVRSAPVVGVGLGLVAVRAADTVEVQHIAVSHNEYLRLAAELGIPGLLAVLTLMGIPFVVGLFGADRSTAASVMWPCLGACMISMAFLNVLDNAQLATLMMGVTGVAWGSIKARRPSPRAAPTLRPAPTPRALVAVE